jgi:hypothetical protein
MIRLMSIMPVIQRWYMTTEPLISVPQILCREINNSLPEKLRKCSMLKFPKVAHCFACAKIRPVYDARRNRSEENAANVQP